MHPILNGRPAVLVRLVRSRVCCHSDRAKRNSSCGFWPPLRSAPLLVDSNRHRTHDRAHSAYIVPKADDSPCRGCDPDIGMSLAFEWDSSKAADNRRKHGVTFLEAETVFGDPLAAIFVDEDHSTAEPREIIIGHSVRSRLLLVSFTQRDERIRIIGARRATKRERRDYEENPIP